MLCVFQFIWATTVSKRHMYKRREKNKIVYIEWVWECECATTVKRMLFAWLNTNAYTSRFFSSIFRNRRHQNSQMSSHWLFPHTLYSYFFSSHFFSVRTEVFLFLFPLFFSFIFFLLCVNGQFVSIGNFFLSSFCKFFSEFFNGWNVFDFFYDFFHSKEYFLIF